MISASHLELFAQQGFKGGMVVFSSLLMHRSGPNVSAHERKGYIVQLTPPGARRRDTGEAIKGPAL